MRSTVMMDLTFLQFSAQPFALTLQIQAADILLLKNLSSNPRGIPGYFNSNYQSLFFSEALFMFFDDETKCKCFSCSFFLFYDDRLL